MAVRTALTNEEMIAGREGELPIWARYALVECRHRWHKVEFAGMEYDQEPRRVLLRVFRDPETLNPTLRYVWQEKGVTWHRENRNGKLGPKLPVRELNLTSTDDKPSTWRYHRRPRRVPNGELQIIQRPQTVQELIVKRSAIWTDMRRVETEFIKNPDWEQQAMLVGYREVLGQLEIDIIVAREEAEESRRA